MAFGHRANHRPKPLVCVQCRKRPRLKERDDKLCLNCATFADEAREKVSKKK